MEKVISCCGIVCSNCPSYPKDCKGCPEIEGIAYWLQYTGEKICGLYDCCINKHKLAHCGQCKAFPCNIFMAQNDPTKSDEENAAITQNQIKLLQNMEK